MSVSRILGLMIVSSWLFVGCSGAKKIDAGGTCILNSDCNHGLVCTWGKCHVACNTSADCPAGDSCITSSDQSNVCQLPGETYCIYNHDCPSGLICGVDSNAANSVRSMSIAHTARFAKVHKRASSRTRWIPTLFPTVESATPTALWALEAPEAAAVCRTRAVRSFPPLMLRQICRRMRRVAPAAPAAPAAVQPAAAA